MDNKKNGIPKLRFPGFTGAWEQRKFSEILAKSDGLRRGPFGSALKKEFFISNSEYTVYEQNNAIYNTWETRYFITPEKFQELHKFQLMPGDFILSGAGTIGRIAQVPSNIIKGVFNQALIRIRINPECTDKSFFLIWMQSESMQRKLTQANPGSAMTNLVPMSEIKKWEIVIPSKAEQNKIGEFIQKINSLIALHQRKLEHLQEQKKGLLQKMFPKNGEVVPEVRFPGFTDAWEQRKLGEITSVITKGTTPLDKSGKGSINFVKVEDLNPDNSGINVHSMISKEEHEGRLKRSILKENDILFSIAGTLGRIGIVKSDILPANTNQALAIVRLKEGNLSYISTVLEGRTVREYIRQNPTVGAQPNLSLKQVSELRISFPTLQEQEQVGNFFNKLNSFIALHQRKLEHLELMKKGLLQQMFV